MSKERLEDIKQHLVLLHNAIDVDEETKDYIFEDLKVEWLIEQAERVQELEVKLKNCQKQYNWLLTITNQERNDLKEQNKRYREGIKQVNNIIVEAIEALDNDEKVNGLEYAVKIIDEALEGESSETD